MISDRIEFAVTHAVEHGLQVYSTVITVLARTEGIGKYAPIPSWIEKLARKCELVYNVAGSSALHTIIAAELPLHWGCEPC